MSLNRLSRGGTVCSLDGHSGYWSEHGDTLYGRALIIRNIIPSATVACMRTALWVWMGGLFPETVDVLSGSHYRTTRHGRPIRVFARRVDRDQVLNLGDLDITSPSRTACDIATISSRRPGAAVFADRVADLMHTYRFTPDDCAAILAANPCAGTMPHAKAFLNTVRMYYEERDHARTRERRTLQCANAMCRQLAQREAANMSHEVAGAHMQMHARICAHEPYEYGSDGDDPHSAGSHDHDLGGRKPCAQDPYEEKATTPL